MVNIFNEAKMMEDIEYAKENNADVIIAVLHWGDEYSRIQAERQEVLANKLFKAGVDIIFGSHPMLYNRLRHWNMTAKRNLWPTLWVILYPTKGLKPWYHTA